MTRLLLVFCFFLVPGMMANAYSQEQVVSLNLRHCDVHTLCQEIWKQTGLRFVYNEEHVKSVGTFDVSVDKKRVEDVLNDVLKDTPLRYFFENDIIYIVRREDDEKPAVTEHKIAGTVRDKTGLPVPGVTVLVKGTTLGVATDVDGKFELTFTQDSATLVFSFVGMKTQEVKYTGQESIDVVMEEDVTEMEEVVVNGIFERRKETYTGATTVVTRDELVKRGGNQNLIQSLKNLDPALNIKQNLSIGSDPNRLPDMELRGTSSFPDIRGEYSSNPNLPLFILDGFETTLEKVMDLDMNRIESVTLLKDAAAKAIYGSKAANGVLVIETTRVQPGELRMNYIGSVDLELPDLSSYNLCNAREKLDLEWKLQAYEGVQPNQDFSKKLLYYEILEEVEKGVNTDWLAQPLRNGVGHKHSLSFEVGSPELRVGLDLSYNKVTGVMKGSDRTSVAGGITVIYQYKTLLFRNQFSFTTTTSNNSPYGDFSEYAKLNPYWRPYNEDGSLRKYLGVGPVFSEKVYNPMFNATLNTKDQSSYTDYTNNTYLEWNIKTGMKLVGRVGLTNTISNAEVFLPGSHLDFIDAAEDDFFLRGSYSQTNGKTLTVSADLNFNYSHSWDRHVLYLNAGATISSSESESYTHAAVGFPNDQMDNIIFAKQYAENSKPTGTESITRDVGFLAAANYSYDDRYLADFSVRASASSQYGADNRWGAFWSAGIGWNVHNEAFFKSSSVVNQLRLRATLGYTGTQNFDSYQGMILYNYFTDDSYQDMIGVTLEGLANTGLKWQQTYDVNYGVDVTLWNRLNVKFDYYRSTTDNLLTDITTPPSLGFESYKDNLGKLQNVGYEFNVNYTILSRPEDRLSLNVFVAGTHNENKIKEISNSLRSLTEEQDEEAADSNVPYTRFVEGQSLNAIWGMKSLGIDPSSGKEVFVRPDGTLTDTWSATDQVVIGDTEPTLSGNLGFGFEYKGFSVYFTGLYRFGEDMYNQTLVDKVENAQLNYNVDKRAYYDAWMQEGDHVQFKSIGDWNSPTQSTSRFVQKLNQFDFSSLSISYDFYRWKFLEKCKLERMQLSFNMNDIGTLSSVKIERGTSYPFARYCSFSLNINF